MSTGPLLGLDLDRTAPLGAQIERQLRAAVRARRLERGAELPSTRTLAADLGVSRGVVVGAYAQLAAEGYIALRRGAPPVVAAEGYEADDVAADPDVAVARARFNLRPDLPDLGLFPRAQWAAAGRAALHDAANTDLAYGQPFGAIRLRSQLAPFLARTRGVAATPDRTGVFAGSTQALFVLASVLRRRGVREIAIEDPGHRWRTRALVAAGLVPVPVPVDDAGLRVDCLGGAAAVVVSPAHQFPSGVVMSAERRRALVQWAVAGGRLVIEHDYDAHFGYEGAAAGALQGLAPEHVAYVGSASPLLVPALRLGWAVVPAALVQPVNDQMFFTGISTSRLTQFTVVEFIERGYLDRQVRKARAAYKRRREALLCSLARHLPDAAVSGAAVGLYASVSLPPDTDEEALLAAARSRGVALDGVGEHTVTSQPPGLVLGFAASPEPTLQHAVRQVAAARRA